MSRVKGRYAPSPTGRMHLGNIFSALLSWLSAKSKGGTWLLRIEDLDPGRSRKEYARLIEDDLHWLGLDWDEGGVEEIGDNGPYSQSLRGEIYENVLDRLKETGFVYPCYCTRADIMATQAPHESDGRIVYAGTCRPPHLNRYDKRKAGLQPAQSLLSGNGRAGSFRLYVPDEDIIFTDRTYGRQVVNLSRHCGDFVVRRADGAWAYQLAVVVDDALMGVTEVVRGSDLLLSSAQQIYLNNLLGYPVPEFAHVPLLCDSFGRRLSKRNESLSMESLRKRYSPGELVGLLASLAGIAHPGEEMLPSDLVSSFSWDNIPTQNNIIVPAGVY